MDETSDPVQVLISETRLRLRRAAVFARAAELGAHTDRERWELLGLSRATYFRLLSSGGAVNPQLRTMQSVLAGLRWTVLEDAFEVPAAERAVA